MPGINGGAYLRGAQAFFELPTTHGGISTLSKARKLAIYCGAGVTINLTDMSWRSLIAGMLSDPTLVGAHPEISDSEAILLAERIDPLVLASILAEYNSGHADNEERADEALLRAIQSRLYNNGTWLSGRLCRNIVTLAEEFASSGTPVHILTSNYDIYLEEFLFLVLSEQAEKRTSDAAGIRVNALPDGEVFDSGRRFPIEPQGRGAYIDITYLHGRVPRSGDKMGDLIVSEIDYSNARKYVVKALKGAFTESDVLIVGASLTDPPLLASLALTKPLSVFERLGMPDDQDTVELARVALLPAVGTGIIDVGEKFESLKPHLRARMNQFGVSLLIPDFYFQISQFCEEVIWNRDSKAYDSFEGVDNAEDARLKSLRYYGRLLRWHDAWSKTGAQDEHYRTFNSLCEALKNIRRTWFASVSDVDAESERAKLELWARDYSSESARTLCLWASTLGVLHDRPALKSEELRIDSGVAAVRAFTEGRPDYVPLRELRGDASFPESDSRWKHFLSVPIVVPMAQSGTVPVGVVTLATMREKTTLPIGKNRIMNSIVDYMENVGTNLLQPNYDSDRIS